MMSNEYNEMFGDAIRRRREYLGLTQLDLANMIGASEYLISEIESGGVGVPAFPYLTRIANALDADIIIALEGKAAMVPGRASAMFSELLHAWRTQCSCTPFGRLLRKAARLRRR